MLKYCLKFLFFPATEGFFFFFPSLNSFHCWKRCILSSGKSFLRPNIKIVKNRFFWTNICHQRDREVLLLSVCLHFWLFLYHLYKGGGQETGGPGQPVLLAWLQWRRRASSRMMGHSISLVRKQSPHAVLNSFITPSHASLPVTYTGHHGATTTGGESKNSWAGGDFPSGKKQAGCWSGQVGWQRQWHHCAGQADVYDHDGDDRLHKVRPRDRETAVFLLNPHV